jgi:DNA-binding Lrp family transcriptional regulator
MDRLDAELLKHLRDDGRVSNVELARRTGVTEKTVRQRIARLVEQHGLRFRAELDKPAAVSRVIYLVRTQAGHRLDEADRLAGLEQVDSVRMTSGYCDIVVEASFGSDTQALEFAARELDAAVGIARANVVQVIEAVRAGQVPSDARLLEFDHAAAALETVQDVLDLTCDVAGALMGARRVFAGLMTTPESDAASDPLFSHTLRWRGLSSRYIETIYGHIRTGQGVPTGNSRGRHLFVSDARSDPLFSPVAELVRAEGFRSFLSLPIMCDDAHLGNVNIYFDEVIDYDAASVSKAQELADRAGAHLARVLASGPS